MRILVDIPDRTLESLAEICAQEGVARAEIIRQAIALYLKDQPLQEDVFGIWKSRQDRVDGLVYERNLREEW